MTKGFIMKQQFAMVLVVLVCLSKTYVRADLPYGCSTGTVSVTSHLYVTEKYQGVIAQTIDKYVLLCLNLERVLGKFELSAARQLVFTHPCIIPCYTELVRQKSLRPLSYLWQTYKDGSITIDKQKFVYEFCHLLALIFEQFLIKLAADLTGQSVQSLTDLLDKLQIDLPLDDLIDILEQCYQKLSLVAAQLNTHQQANLRKAIALALVVVCVVVRQLYQRFGSKSTDTSNPSIVQTI